MEVKKGLLYSKSHEWVQMLDDGSALVGLTDYAQTQLGDLVFVNLPQEGDQFGKEDVIGDVESVKAVSDIYCPVAATIVSINEELLDAPQKINETPYDAWLIKVSDVEDMDDLLNAEQYEQLLETL